jgi:hypothetical protein
VIASTMVRSSAAWRSPSSQSRAASLGCELKRSRTVPLSSRTR